MDLLKYNGKIYPKFQEQGYASQFAIPFAKYYCKGVGYDIGCHKIEWSYPGSIPVDLILNNNGYDAFNLPEKKVDYIYSSHCLEHLDSWINALNYWKTKLKKGGILFLYLPHYNQEYWRPWNNTKHKHIMDCDVIIDFLKNIKFINIFNSERDLNDSFIVVGEKG